MTALKRKWFVAVAWAITCVGYAYVFVSSRITTPTFEGYERDWDFQVLVFLVTRMPVMIALLAVVFWSLRRSR